MIRFTALGSLELSGGDGRPLLPVLSQPRRLALLAYLALARPPGFHRRDTLTALFWPDADADHARDALSQALRFLRRSLGDEAILGRGAEEVGISRERVWCDVAELEAALDAGRPDAALALYRGELLAGFNVSDAPEFERWLDGERARLRERVASAAVARAGAAARTGNPAGAATWARRGAALEPFDETLHRQVLEYLDAAGDRAGALQEHEAFRRRLREELESEPTPETAGLVEAIRQRSTGATPPRVTPAAAATPVTSEASLSPVQSTPAAAVPPRRRSRRTVLTALAALVLLAGALAAGWVWLVPARRARHAPTAPTRIVVLPFQNLGRPEDQYFADGVTDELTTRLAAVRRLSVISRTSANQYRKTTKSMRQIGTELGVAYVLEGSVRWARTAGGAGQVRITPQLIRVRDDSHVWAGSYDRELREIFAIQSDIARNVVDAMSVALGTREREQVAARPTTNMKAYDYFLQAGHQDAYVDSQIRRGIEQYRQAIRLDPAFVQAYLGLAGYSSLMVNLRFDTSPGRCATADTALRRAEALAPDAPGVHMGRAWYYFRCLLDEARALAETDAAVRLGLPQDGQPWSLRALLARRRGRFLEAAALGEQAFYQDPRNIGRAYETGNSYAAAGRFEDARRWYEWAVALNPRDPLFRYYAAEMALLLTGEVDSARSAMRRADPYTAGDSAGAQWMWIYFDVLARDYASALRRVPRATVDDQTIIMPTALLRAQLYLLMNRRAEALRSFAVARDTLEARRRAIPRDHRVYRALGLAYAGLGRRQEALAAAARGVELVPMSRNLAGWAPGVYWQARTLTLLGDRRGALDKLELLQRCPFSPVAAPYGATAVQLRLEPWWDPLRSEPRFQRLAQGR